MKRTYSVAELTAMIISDNVKIFYNSRAWRELSHNVIKEHHYECLMCKHDGKVVAATLVHHVNELKVRPDLAYSRYYIDSLGKRQIQLMPLCFECHEKIHGRGIFQVEKEKFETPEKW